MALTRKRLPGVLALAFAAMALVGAWLLAPAAPPHDGGAMAPAMQPSLSVAVTTPEIRALQMRVPANGNIEAWQEVSIGAETSGLRLAEIAVDVGDAVRRGQVLARFAPETVQVDLARSRAVAAEAEAALAEASGNARRARAVRGSGALSNQQIQQYEATELGARARHLAALADVQAQTLRLEHTRVLTQQNLLRLSG
ncbi:efflux RND transporter periplasmic adaptor subunit [Bordetella sp. 2513F-2]